MRYQPLLANSKLGVWGAGGRSSLECAVAKKELVIEKAGRRGKFNATIHNKRVRMKVDDKPPNS
jgi:hypothetical protein